MTKTQMRSSVVLAALSIAVASSSARAQSTAFTYQGRLDDAGVPANGLHDFRATLFDAASGGAVVGSPQCADDVDVIDGVFTLELDFGQVFATASERHLLVEVRKDTGLPCADLTGFVAMEPRQKLTATPLASHAKSAFALDAADGSPANAVYVDDAGRVGIGTTTPSAQIHVKGTVPALFLQDTASAANQAGYVSYRNDAGVETAWVGYGTAGSPHFSIVNARASGNIVLEALTVTSAGSVGIGTATPAVKLDVRGDIALGASGQYQATAGEEKLRVIRGKVSGAGAILLGTGFTATRSSAGTYVIGFSPQFAAIPAMTVSAEWVAGTAYTAMTNGVLMSGGGVRITNGSGTLVDRDFYFIAIGPR